MKGYKGFDKDLKCRGFQYEVGKDFEEKDAVCCKKGFHFCENPLDVFGYYPPADSRYCEVEGDGKLDGDYRDTKVAASKIKIKAEIGIPGLIAAGVEYIKSNIDWKNAKESNTGDRSAATNTGYRSAATNTGDQSAATNTGDQSAATNTGDRSAATNTGYRSAATNTGYRSAATNTGDRSAATVEGKESIAMAIGIESKAKGALGCYIVLAEWICENYEWHLKNVKSTKVDGKRIKENTFYMLKNNKFVACDEQ